MLYSNFLFILTLDNNILLAVPDMELVNLWWSELREGDGKKKISPQDKLLDKLSQKKLRTSNNVH